MKSIMYVLLVLGTLQSQAQIIGNDAFLKSDYLELGLGEDGAFGTSANPPAGYHPRANNIGLGFVADPDEDGWDIGLPDFCGDFFIPGSPVENMTLSIGDVDYTNNLKNGFFEIPGSLSNYVNSTSVVSVDWNGNVGGINVFQKVELPLDNNYILITCTLTNTSDADIMDIYFSRNVDPDNEQPLTGNFSTTNTIISNPDGTTDQAIVEAVGTTYGCSVALGAINPNAKAVFGGFDNTSANDLYNSSDFESTVGASQTEDRAIALAFNVGTLSPGEEVVLTYGYLLDPDDLDDFIVDLTSAPDVLCKDVEVELSSSTLLINASDFDDGSTDAETASEDLIFSFSETDSDFNSLVVDCDDLGDNAVTIWAWDEDGKVSEPCSAVLTITDNIIPEIICPDNIILSSDEFDCGTNVDFDVVGTDNCDNDVITICSHNSGEFFSLGTTTVTCVVTDGSDNSTSCSFDIIINDETPPVMDCSDINIDLEGDGQYTITEEIIASLTANSFDECNPIEISIADGITEYNCTHVDESWPITIQGIDSEGNSSECVINVIVSDPLGICVESITAVCKDLTLLADENCEAIPLPKDFDDGSSSTSGFPLSFSVAPEPPYAVGVTDVTLTVTSGGLSSSCMASVTVEDFIPPTIAVADFTVFLDSFGSAEISESDVVSSIGDNCGISIITLFPTNFDCTMVGENVVTISAEDIYGNVSMNTITVTVIDEILPTVAADDTELFLDENGLVVLSEDNIDLVAADNCEVLSISYMPTEFDCFNDGINEVEIIIEDVNGNSNSTVIEISLMDTIPPTLEVQDVTLALDDNGMAVLSVDDVVLSSSDNCGVTPPTLSETQFECTDEMINEVTVTVVDYNGNVTEEIVSVSILDEIPPVAICTDAIIVIDTDPIVSIGPSLIDAGSSDNCGTPILSISKSDFSCDDLGMVEVELTASLGGLSHSCIATVTVVDESIPVLECPENIEIELLELECDLSVAIPEIVYSDVCGEENILVELSSDLGVFEADGAGWVGHFEIPGLHQVEVVVIDPSGNYSSCMFSIKIDDHVSPEIGSCPLVGPILVEPDGGCGAFVDFPLIVEARDNCDLTGENLFFESSHQPGEWFDYGLTEVVFTVTDGNGNQGTCSFDVIVGEEVKADYNLNSANGLSISFQNMSVGAQSYIWDFGDGTTSTIANPFHTFPSEGFYEVCLTAQGVCVTDEICYTMKVRFSNSFLSVSEDYIMEQSEKIKSSDVTQVTVPEEIMRIYPNPATDKTHINYFSAQADVLEITIMDKLGRKVYQDEHITDAGTTNIPIATEDFPVGVYHVRVVTQDKRTQSIKTLIIN